jgi:hypothetical protein
MTLKFHEYLAKRDKISLEEAARKSLARTWELAKTGKVMALITAFVTNVSYEQNIGRNQALSKDIRDAKFGYTPLYGYWSYDVIDSNTGAETGQKEKVREDSFLVSASEKMPNKEFKSIILSWVQRYQQESAVIKYVDSDMAYLLAADGTEKQLGTWSINRLADVYSQMKHGNANRIFVFEAADNHSWSARLAIQTMERNG